MAGKQTGENHMDTVINGAYNACENRCLMRGVETNLIVPFVKEGRTKKIITAYPCKRLEKELKNKEDIRWVRIR
jgi:hypothetical protein